MDYLARAYYLALADRTNILLERRNYIEISELKNRIPDALKTSPYTDFVMVSGIATRMLQLLNVGELGHIGVSEQEGILVGRMKSVLDKYQHTEQTVAVPQS